jgi:hypothetical protein
MELLPRKNRRPEMGVIQVSLDFGFKDLLAA